jgi:hypothetical protein
MGSSITAPLPNLRDILRPHGGPCNRRADRLACRCRRKIAGQTQQDWAGKGSTAGRNGRRAGNDPSRSTGRIDGHGGRAIEIGPAARLCWPRRRKMKDEGRTAGPTRKPLVARQLSVVRCQLSPDTWHLPRSPSHRSSTWSYHVKSPFCNAPSHFGDEFWGFSTQFRVSYLPGCKRVTDYRNTSLTCGMKLRQTPANLTRYPETSCEWFRATELVSGV